MVAAVPSVWRLGPGPINLADEADRTWLIPTVDRWFEGLPEKLVVEWAADPDTRLADIMRVSTLQAALPMVASCVGVAIVPEAVAGVAPRGVDILELTNDIVPSSLLAFWACRRIACDATNACYLVGAGHYVGPK